MKNLIIILIVFILLVVTLPHTTPKVVKATNFSIYYTQDKMCYVAQDSHYKVLGTKCYTYNGD